jgi:NAD(P)-dependent dehydrogenase (short-subunit alcohol dehydrogenase family)
MADIDPVRPVLRTHWKTGAGSARAICFQHRTCACLTDGQDDTSKSVDLSRGHSRPERDTIVQNRAAILLGRRVGTADEVAQVILMLITNNYMTGAVVHVDGGGRFV